MTKQEKEKALIDMINDISSRGHSAEVKKDRNGCYVVYEVKKAKELVG